ncbi:response regulator [Magnetospirillum sp. J10]|uniref:Response regulator n=1 Tax=Magnetospirillum sulfuroxidans TaxID=611300 RepID=A0ABS5IEV8_9PROT|nr:response regulator [Magnetospirillum sulfuroxidans]
MVVIEDEPMVLMAYELMFEAWGYRFVGADCASSALTQLMVLRRAPDFIVADYRLAEGNTGTQAISLLRQAFGHDIPGLLVTGETSIETLRDAASTGFPLLRKPVNSRQLQDAVVRCIGGAC